MSVVYFIIYGVRLKIQFKVIVSLYLMAWQTSYEKHIHKIIYDLQIFRRHLASVDFQRSNEDHITSSIVDIITKALVLVCVKNVYN